MNTEISKADAASVQTIVSALESAWNAGDGRLFAAPMAPDADFVTIRAERFRGRQAIADGRDAIFRTVYAGSRIKLTTDTLRLLTDDVALLHVGSELDAPSGPLAGRHNAVFSAVLRRNGAAWEIAAFHNTLAPPAGRG